MNCRYNADPRRPGSFPSRIVGSLLLFSLLTLATLPALSQSLRREVFSNIGGVAIANMTSAPGYPDNPDSVTFITSFEAPINIAENYGTRIRGYLHPPVTGDYTLWISGDDNCELFLSTDETSANVSLIASVNTWTSSREWTKEPNQKSAPTSLQEGRRYYVEARHKEGGGGDHVAVAWTLPDGTFIEPIPGNQISPWLASTNPPSIVNQPADLTLIDGDLARFTVGAVGAEPLQFQWQRDGIDIELAIDSSLVIDRVTLADNGARFQCVISNALGSITSREALLNVSPEMTPPVLEHLNPPVNARVRTLTQLEITFSEAIANIDPDDLLINGQAATNMIGFGAGPYLFQFPAQPPGIVEVTWTPSHGIVDLSPLQNPFTAMTWNYVVDPEAPLADLILTEFMASNGNGLLDESGRAEDWIELHNRGVTAVNLEGWALSDDRNDPGRWTFPSIVVQPGQYLVVFASAANRKVLGPGLRFHTNFKLSRGGEFIGLFSAESPRTLVSEIDYPEQRTDVSYGIDVFGLWRFYSPATPEAANGSSTVAGIVADPHASVERGFFDQPFNLILTTTTPDAQIRYTLDSSEPTAIHGQIYSQPLRVTTTTTLRVAAFKENRLPSRIVTHTYLMNMNSALASLPAISVVTEYDNLWGETGIMEINPRNTTQRGIQWERPSSAELIHADGSEGFGLDTGLRIQGGNWVRGRYDPNANLPFSKYSFRFYFRGDYGSSRLNHPLIPGIPIDVFERIVLRAGMNDHSNPFIKDELARLLGAETGQVNSHGTLVNLFLNGEYRGYYNPTERIDQDFLRSWHGGDNDWDLIAQFGEVREGDSVAWNAMMSAVLRDQTSTANYLESEQHLDLVNFIDYLLVNAYGTTGDWPHNNWRAARERKPGARYRFLIWDAEGAFNSLGGNTFTDALGGSSEIPRLYRSLRESPEFRLLFADRHQKHFFNQGALTAANVRRIYLRLKNEISGVLPNIDTRIDNWIPNRQAILEQDMQEQGLIPTAAPPTFNQHGGRVPSGFNFIPAAPLGAVYYTLDGTDPRNRFENTASPTALTYNAQPVILNTSLTIKARTLVDTNWSALVEADFKVGELGFPIRLTEIMYHPLGGQALEFVELQNTGGSSIDLSGMRFEGIDYLFPSGTLLGPGATLVLSSSLDPGAFAQSYPAVTVFDRFGGSLSNGGEELRLKDSQGNILLLVRYNDKNAWPRQADGNGSSLEIINVNGDPNAPANWRASTHLGGSPGTVTPTPPVPDMRLNEIMADNFSSVPNDGSFPDWIEIKNTSPLSTDLGGWTLSDGETDFTFQPGTLLDPGALIVVWCDNATNSPGIHSGFALNRDGETVSLFNPSGTRIDAFTFGFQVADLSVGRIGDNWTANNPTPLLDNIAATLATPAALRINEWMANPRPGRPDWIELHNTHPFNPVALQGIHLDNGTSRHQLQSFSFLGPRSQIQLIADKDIGPNHLSFKLPATGSTITLYDATGASIDRVTSTAQNENVSRGRLPDGGPSFQNFSGSASPGRSNYLINHNGPILNEIMALNLNSPILDSQDRRADWIELRNPNPASFDLSQMSLSEGSPDPSEWSFPPGTVIPGNGYLVVWCDSSRPPSTNSEPDLNLGRALDSESGGVYLFNSTGQIADFIEYGFQIPDQTIGSSAGQWRLLSSPTPGAINSPPSPLGNRSLIRVNEWMALPTTGDDWIELYNTDSLPLDLAGLHLTDNPTIAGRRNTTLAPLSFIQAHGFVILQADQAVENGHDHVGFRLHGGGESIRIYDSDESLIDVADYGLQTTGVSSGRIPDGNPGIAPFPGTPTPGAPNVVGAGPPIISVQPASQLVRAGDFVFLEVTAVATTRLTYQWFFGGLPVANETNTTLTLPDIRKAQEGNYQVAVNNQAGSVLSQNAVLIVDAPPSFIESPQSITALVGDTVSFRALTDGNLPMGYRWRRGGLTLTSYVAQSHVSSYTIPNVQLSDAGTYSLILTNEIFWRPGVISRPSAILTVLVDSDGDGTPDDWETAQGLNPNDPADALLDSDDDGLSNREEYVSGTDPNDPDSYLRVDAIDETSGGISIQFIARDARSYSVQYRDSPDAGPWQKLDDVLPAPGDRLIEVIDPTPPADRTRYYRIVTPREF